MLLLERASALSSRKAAAYERTMLISKDSVFVEKIQSVAKQPVLTVSLQYSFQAVGCILTPERTVFLKKILEALCSTMQIYGILAE